MTVDVETNQFERKRSVFSRSLFLSFLLVEQQDDLIWIFAISTFQTFEIHNKRA